MISRRRFYAPSRQIVLQRLDFELASRDGADPVGRRDGA
jgi:hypothetical protein